MQKYDKKDTISYAIGTTLVFELLYRKPDITKKIYISPKQKRDATYDKLFTLAKEKNVSVIENNEKIFASLSGKSNVMAIGEFAKFSSVLNQNENHVVLVNPSNMGNLGTIMRTCAAFGVKGLAIIRPAADAFDPKTVRSSMGAIFSLPFCYFDSFEQYQKITGGNRAYFPFMLKAKTRLSDAKKQMPFSLIFGNEATGLPDSFLNLGTPILIPQTSEVDSLNLDNAASIGIYSFFD